MRCALLFLVLLCLTTRAVHGRLLGVQAAHASYYDAAESSKSFRCLDGSKSIPISAVNNDVCDCADGSDEPGTSACAAMHNGVAAQLPEKWRFQCTNKDFLVQMIPHNRVNDGICDCCDGSDELLSGVACPNRCAEVQKEQARKEQEEEKRMQTAAANKAAMRAELVKHRDELARALPGQKKEAATIRAELPDLEEKNAALQKALESVREELRLEREKWDAAREEREAAEDASSCIKWRQTGRCKADGPREHERDKDCGAVIPSRDSGYCECGKAGADEEVESSDVEEKENEEEESQTVKYEFPCGHHELTCMHVCDHNGEAAVGAAFEEPQDPDSYSTPEATAAEEAVTTRKERLAALEKIIDTSTKTLESTVPSTEELLRTLDGKTFTMDFQDYTYAVTMFRNVHQRNKGDSSGGTLLGNWKSFAENTYAMWAKDAYDLTQMLYHDGQRCWNGVTRKTDIQLVCGPDNKLSHIEEPAMCIYRMVFETPALCDE